jgi:iron complex transport system substrate-binding protein
MLYRLLTPFLLCLPLLAAAPPRRIVSTAPNLTEMLFALGLGDRVVGVTTYCRYPEEARKLPKIGTFLEPDFERIVALRPDLVLTIKNPVQLSDRLRNFKLNVVEVNPETVSGIFDSLQAIGAATGAVPAASALSRQLRSGLDELRTTGTRLPPRRVLFLVGRTPGTLDGLIGAGKGTYLDELLALAGGSNILADTPMPYPKVSVETILARDPDVIIDMGDAAHAEGVPKERQEQVIALWARYPNLKAVRERHVLAVADDRLVVPGPRVVEAVVEFRRLLYPQASAR